MSDYARITKARRLRVLLDSCDLVRLAGAHDGLSAKIVERAGFEAVWASGFELSASYGVPDASILTMTQFLQSAYVMNCATRVPIIADCDSGFGQVNNVISLVREYERHGIAGICLEDKTFPKNNSFSASEQTLAPLDEFVEKIRVAKSTQTDPDFIVIARTEAFIAGHSLDEALKRAYAYEEAGADLIAVHSRRKTPIEVEQFMKEWSRRTPIVVIPTTYPQITVEDLKGLGVRMVIYANHGLRSAIRSMKSNLEELYRTGTLMSIEDRIATIDEVFDLQGAGEWHDV